ncbi:MAG: sigma-70 family RNA polymerase sigma factor [Solirubrobacterales bacterium]
MSAAAITASVAGPAMLERKPLDFSPLPRVRDNQSTGSERRIAAGLRERRPEAVERAYEAYGGAVFGYLLKAVGDRAAAEDVQQQVFLEVWQRGEAYDPDRAGLLTWIMTIARSRAIDHLRKRVPEPHDPTSPQVLSEPAGETADSPERIAERWRVAGLLRRIPPEEAELLRMRFYRDLSQREIAEATGMPLGTVKMRMVKAFERLREMIESEEER